jgi:7-cyano-7-deazaguanine synthase
MKRSVTASEGAVVLLSGGQDSTTCLLWSLKKYGNENVYPVTFSYDQSHEVETLQAFRICIELSTKHVPVLLHIPALREIGGGALTSNEITFTAAGATDTGNVYAEEHGLPATVIPGRNVVFLALAAAYGAKLGVYTLVTGGCLADYEGYPDCRPGFYYAMEEALAQALDDGRVEILTPLTQLSKAETFQMADDFGHLDLIVEHTHTCYKGDRDNFWPWGYGCGECPACQTRSKGWYEFVGEQVST